MTNWLKYAAVTMLVFVVFSAGYQLASARGDAALKSYQLEAAVARAEQGRKDYAKLVSAVDQVVAADVDIEKLLRESVGLIEEGRSLLLRNAAVHDALVSTHD